MKKKNKQKNTTYTNLYINQKNKKKTRMSCFG